MKTRFLFPHKFKIYGWVIFIVSFIFGILKTTLELIKYDFKMPIFAVAYDYSDPSQHSFFPAQKFFGLAEVNGMNQFIGVFFVIGGLLVAFSKEKTEDEFINKLRLESLVWATFINYILIMLAIIFVYGAAFQWIMLYGMFTILILFIIRFNLVLYLNKRAMQNEKLD